MTHQLRSAYGPKHRVSSRTTQKSMTKQSFKKECDINAIMARYQKSGIVDHINTHEAHYGETSAQSFTEAQFLIAEASSMFEELPSKARAYFQHDPKAFLSFMEGYDPDKDKQQLIDLGMARDGLTVALPSPPGDEGEPAADPAAEQAPDTSSEPESV